MVLFSYNNNMKKWLKLICVISVFAIISLVIFFILKANNLTNIEKLRKFLEKHKKFSLLIFILISLVLSTVLCFVPVMGTALVSLGCVMFGPTVGFFSSLTACYISSTILFFIGDKLGEKFAIKLIGKEELESTQDMIDSKSKLLLPMLLAIPSMPDDAICLVAGITKMKYRYFAPICLIFEAIDIGIVCFFSSGIINWSTLQIIDWIFLINLVVIDIFLLIKFEKYMKNRKK